MGVLCLIYRQAGLQKEHQPDMRRQAGQRDEVPAED